MVFLKAAEKRLSHYRHYKFDMMNAVIKSCTVKSLFIWLQFLVMMMVIVIATPTSAFLLVPIMCIYIAIQRLYVAGASQVKRLEATLRSPIFSHFSESINGKCCGCCGWWRLAIAAADAQQGNVCCKWERGWQLYFFLTSASLLELCCGWARQVTGGCWCWCVLREWHSVVNEKKSNQDIHSG